MKNKLSFLPAFIVALFLALVILFFAMRGGFTWFSTTLQTIFAPGQKATIGMTRGIDTSAEKLKEENAKLQSEIAKLQVIAQDNKALRDQFQTTSPSSQTLIPAKIVGEPNFLPSITAPDVLIIDKGTTDGVYANSAVVFKDNLIGKVTNVNNHFAKVLLLTNKAFTLTAKTAQTNALGIIRGQGAGEYLLDNVLLSDKLTVGDAVVTGGETNFDGKGVPPGLILGKISSVDKNPSALFQKARIQSLVDIPKLSMVFVVSN